MAFKFLLLLILQITKYTHAQNIIETGEFPQPLAVSLYKPVTATSTCGVELEQFCKYSTDAKASLSPNCNAETCNNTCAFSNSAPTPVNLAEIGTLGDGVASSVISGPGMTAVLEFSNSFINISSSSAPQISNNGYTFAAWIKQDEDNEGVLISKATNNGLDRTYSLSVTENSVTFDYLPNNEDSGYSTLTITSLELTSNFWHHIAVTIYEDDFGLYINGTIEHATGLDAAIRESSNAVFLGQISPSSSQYNGLMQDVYSYSQALTAREVEELVVGELPFNHLQSECRCSSSHPVINSISLGLCIQHEGTTTERGSEARLNSFSHTVGYVNDNNFLTTWISEINLQQSNISMTLVSGSNSAYELIFVFVRYGAPAPKAAVLEKSADGGNSYQPLQYFASDCNNYFGLENDADLQSNDDVNCITSYSSRTPTSGVTTRVRFADGSRGELDNSNEELQNFILSDHIRIRLLDYFTMNTTDQHRYYSIADITVAARCACKGHAPRCSSDITAICDCVHNTQGDRCEECLPLYNDKPWRAGTNDLGYPCKECSCNNHATTCHYNASTDAFPESYDLGGGGVCNDCQDNTAGNNCETCAFGYYRKAGVNPSDSEPCTSCGCDEFGSIGVDCVKHEGIPGKIAGQCDCKANVEGLTCSECKSGFFNLLSSNSDGCEPCGCNTDGTVGGQETCNSETGQCVCKLNVEGLKCDRCVNGTQGLSASNSDGCSSCNCNSIGSLSEQCDQNTGNCTCKSGVMGISCDQCATGYYGFSESGCQSCECSSIGSSSLICNVNNGICSCLSGYTGQNCDQCASGFFNSSPGCIACQCNEDGTVADQTANCNADTGQCMCKDNVIGRDCDTCASNFTNLQESGCSACDCVLANTNTTGVLCHPVTSQCACLSSASGLRCDTCQEGYYVDLDQTCLECNCDTNGGAVGSTCTALTGQCFCANENITGRACDQCAAGHFDFPNCNSCQCNVAGSTNAICDVNTGECQCKEFVTGMNCDTCAEGYETLEVSNPFGCSKDPEEQSPPTASTVLSRSILLTWLPPEKPNGVIALYSIIRDGSLIDSVPGSVLSFNDTDLIPNTVYVYQIESENIAGSTVSDGISVTTLEGAPQQISPPKLTVINSTSLRADWLPPNVTNGIVTTYNLILVAVDNAVLESPLTKFSGLAFTAVASGLSPFSVNTFVLQVCTSQECGSSGEVSATTAESLPSSQTPPSLVTLNSTAVKVSWEAPSQPNGVIVKYEIFQRSSPFSGGGMSVANVSGDVLSLVVVGSLQPFTDYEFSIIAFTSVGGAQSGWTRVSTDEAVPENLLDPTVIPVSSSEIRVEWFEPESPNGEITLYVVSIQYLNQSEEEIVNSSSVGSYVVPGLSPFTNYGFFVLVCNIAGCASSNLVFNVTLESAPSGLSPPYFSNITDTSLQLTWNSPITPNGIITDYFITRSRPSLQSSPAKRQLGTAFYGVDFASYASTSDLQGFTTTISLMFKTLRPDGILVYSINNLRTDMIALELRAGIPWFIFDAGSGPAAIRPTGDAKYNDGEWHEVVASHSGRSGEITVDGSSTGTGQSLGTDQFVGKPDVLYIGGLENNAALTTIAGPLNPNATLNGFSFAGCLFGVKFKESYLNLSALVNPNPGVGSPNKGCPIGQQETGITFLGGGYLSMPYSPPKTDPFSISVWFRTIRPSGLFFFAYSSDSYILAALEDSDIVVKVKGESSNEILLSSSQISLQSNLCSGQWYKLEVLKESDGMIVNIANQSISASAENVNINATSNFYLGGVPASSEAAWDSYTDFFSAYPTGFSGCMRNFQMNSEIVDLHKDFGDALEHVRFDGCDASLVDSSLLCNQEERSVGTGLEQTVSDSNLVPFTEYLYQVTTQNSVGETFSSWSLGMTAEGSPVEVGVVSVSSATSSSLRLNWVEAQTSNGLVNQYQITGVPISTVGLDAPTGSTVASTVNIKSPTQSLNTQLSGLEPATNYSIVLQVTTGGGQGTGPPIYATTLEDVPVGVQLPNVTSRGSTSVTLQWTKPSQPNGIITVYRLYIAESAIETTETTVTAQSLVPFTTYEFTLEACTEVGCTNSSTASVATLEGTPEGLNPPVLLGLSSTTVQASWAPPSVPNGVITHYELRRVFGPDLSQSELVANTTELVATVSQLLPNTLYHFRLLAHNSFGSVTSNTSSITTPEDTPEQILPPDVTVISSTSLLVTWQEPLQPNGLITNYTVFQNGVSAFTGKTNFSYLSSGLQPFTVYTYFLLVCTSKGCGASSMRSERTAEATPESIQQPEVTATLSDSATITIKPVGQPNGVVRYILRVLGEFLIDYVNGTRKTVVETRVVYNESVIGTVTVEDLIPFASYSTWLEVTNGAGSLSGEQVLFTSSSAAPELLSPPQLSLVSSTALKIVWSPPVHPNGIITTYNVTLNVYLLNVLQTLSFQYDGNTTNAVVYDLLPFSDYTVRITAANSAGNVTSEGSTILTGETAPADFDMPTVLSTTSYSIAVTWDPPATPNGVILNYTVVVILSDSELEETISTFSPLASDDQYNVTGLMPFTEYNISIETCNSAGCVASPSVESMTNEAAPELIAAPTFSTSPDAVTIYWEEPGKKNGIITEYSIYRALSGGMFSILDSVSGSLEPLQYNDATVEPFTTYLYYIEASTSAGSGAGDSGNVTTQQAAPEGVSPPVLEALSSSTVLVTILLPLKPNGVITHYSIGSYTTSSNVLYRSVLVSDDPQLNISYTDTELDPFTVYTYFIIAFTTAGNTTGNTSSVQTLEAPPTDLSPPSIVLSTDTSILIGWQPPLEENGIINTYTVVRADVGYDSTLHGSLSDCCEAFLSNDLMGSGDVSYNHCLMITETDGDTTSFIEDGLNPYFYYAYCIVAYNGAGGVASGHSDPLQTSPAPKPLAGPNVTALVINSTAVSVSWSKPGPEVLLGPLTSYTLYVKEAGESGLGEELLSSLEQEYLAVGLTPSTTYTFVVEVSNSKGTELSTPIDATTLDGIPLGVQNPLVLTTSATSLLLLWEEPQIPNGKIIRYSIFLNSVLYHNQSTPGSLSVTGLKPYTTYTVRLEACTVLGCTKSGLSSNRTFEAAPSGFASPVVAVQDAYSAYVSWMAPLQPNGVVTQYNVYVRVQVDCSIEESGPCYQKEVVFSGFAFNYTVTGLSPATEYGFEVVAVNGGGNVSSGVTTETTDDAPPTFVSPPDVLPLSANSMLVTWSEPDEPNGVIIGYYLLRNGNRIEGVFNTLTYTDISVQPFTEYRYIVQACTSAGCTNSTETVNATFEAPPTGFDDPVLSNIQSDSLIVSWEEPSSPNGIITGYSLYFGNGTTIFSSGMSNTSVVEGLSPYTNYSFGVTVCNSAGCVDSSFVTGETSQAPPTDLLAPTVKDLSSKSVEVSWQPPSEPNGVITSYKLRRDGVVVFDGLALLFDDESLEGDTQYTYTVEAFNNAGSVTSPSIVIRTQADIPSGVNIPTTLVLNSTAIYAEWTEPETDNGVISAYKLFVDGEEEVSGLQFSHTVTALEPFTAYSFYIQVCNQAGCASSKSVSNTTKADIPSGLSAPTVTVILATSVLVSWNAPTKPNGLISAYRVFRRPTNNPLLTLIQFVGGPDTTSFTNQDLSPFTSYEYQVVAFNSVGQTESEWTEVTTLEAPPTGMASPTFPLVQSTLVTVSWEEPTNPNGVLTQYEVLYRPLLGELMSAVTVPSNTTMVNVSGLSPFTIYEFKIRVSNNAGQGESDFETVQTDQAAPEGLGVLILVTRTSESLTLTWDEPLNPNGVISEYVLYLNGEEEYRDTPRIATIDRLKPFTGYSIQLEACTSSACTEGVIQGFTTEESSPIGQPPPTVTIIDARSVMMVWDFPIQPNGIISSYEVFRLQVAEPLVNNSTEDSTLVHTTSDVSTREFNNTGLTPDTGYQYAIRANNSVGFSLSAYLYIQTPQAAPELVAAPDLEVMGTSEIIITWDPPGKKNGELTQYQVFRTSPGNLVTKEYTGLNREFTDTGLEPFTQYSYLVEACTIAGCTNGSSTVATTDESIPKGLDPPTLTALSSFSISVKWSPPSTPNGELVSYKVNLISPISINITKDGDTLAVNISSLQPYVDYTVRIQACTSVGCLESETSTVRTLESIPMLQNAPLVFALGPSSVDVSWTQPGQPNGVIIRYILRRNNTIVQDGSKTSFTDVNLLPSRSYAYDVQSFTSVGGGERSDPSIVTTHSDTPTDIAPPMLTPLGSTAILAQWQVPGVTNGVIQKYLLYVNETLQSNSTEFGHVVSGLKVFTTYAFRVEACTTTCGSSLYSYASTLEASPEGQAPPTVVMSSNQSVLVTWSSPSTPNGIILTYLVERAQMINGQLGAILPIAEDLPSSTEEYLDSDDSLAPAMTYNYRVTAENSVGSVTSDFTSITLPDGVPIGLAAPVFINKTSTTFTVSVSPPETTNGLLTQYTLFGDNLFPIVKIPVSQTDPVFFTHTGLDPYTVYRVYPEVCTVAGCVLGPSVTIQTNEDVPEGLLSPFVSTETSRRIRIEWSLPSKPNGIVTGYKLFYKLPCPQPQVTLTATAVQCTETSYQLLANTTDQTYLFDSTLSLSDPHPYTSYQFILQAENVAGTVTSPETEVVTTDESVPEQISPLLFTVYQSNKSIALDWGKTFRLNGQLKGYTVIRDGVFLLIGTQTYAVFPNQPTDTVLYFSVKAINTNFEFTSSSIPLEIETPQVVVPSVSMVTPSTTGTSESPTDRPFYKDPAFIVGMVVIAIICCFILVLVALCCIRPNPNRMSDKYDTLKSQKGSPLQEDVDGTVQTSWVHERMTPVPSYNDALHNYPKSDQRTLNSYSPVKAEMMSRESSHSPQSKAELAARLFHGYSKEEIPLTDTHITRLSFHEEIPLMPVKPSNNKSHKLVEEGASVEQQQSESSEQFDEEETAGGTLRKNIPLTDSQEFMLDTKI